MKLTDDFLADLEAQLGAAAAGTLRRRRRDPRRLARPVLVAAVTAAAVFAFVLAAGTGTDVERAVVPPAPPASSGVFELQTAQQGRCATEPGDVEIPSLSVLRRPYSGGDASASPRAREARADMPVTVVPMADVRPCVSDGSSGPGACVIVGDGEYRTACWPLAEIEAGRAAAGLGEGFLVALLPDGMGEATFVIGDERDTYRVTDNIVVANLENAKAGARVELIGRSVPSTGCGDGISEPNPLPGDVSVAVPMFQQDPPTALPDPVMDLLAKAGANRIWAGEARLLKPDRGVDVWVVPVADSRFAECDEPLIQAPRAWEGTGACLVATHAGRIVAALCSDLAQLTDEIATPPLPGGTLVLAFQPHGAHSIVVNGHSIGAVEPARGVLAGVIPRSDGIDHHYETTEVGEVLADPMVAVLGEGAQTIRERLEREGFTTGQIGDHPPVARSGVMYAGGLAEHAREVAERLGIQDVAPLDLDGRLLGGPQPGVVVVVGDDLRP